VRAVAGAVIAQAALEGVQVCDVAGIMLGEEPWTISQLCDDAVNAMMWCG
jgi:hypothetical protein